MEVLSRFGVVESTHDVGVISFQEVVSFQGKFTSVKTEAHLRELERKLDLSGFSRAIKKRVYSLAVEMIQNIVHHGLSCPNEVDSSFAVVSQYDSIHLISQNFVFVSDSGKLQSAIDTINAMTDAELRKYHVELLCDNDFSIKGGAGLGLVTLARKSDGKIDYHLECINPTTSTLSLHIMINASNNLKE